MSAYIRGRQEVRMQIIVACAVFILGFAAATTALALPEKAHAAGDKPEPGVVYTQYHFDGEGQTGLNRVFTTYTADKQFYTARINATSGVVNVDGCWRVKTSEGVDITGECSLDAQSGLVAIPRTYIDSPATIEVILDAVQSAKTVKVTTAIVSGVEQGQSSVTKVEVSASATTISLPVAGGIKAVTQDSQLIDPSEWSSDGSQLSISGHSAMSGSITVYLDSYAPDVIQHNAIQIDQDTAIQRSLARSAFAAAPLSVMPRAGGFSGSGWIYSTNPGGGNWDYTDYVLSWDGGSATLYCCEHGVYHMPQSDGGTVWFSATHTGTSLDSQYDVTTDTTIEHHAVYRDYYSIYVNAGSYQDVSGSWSTTFENVTYTPRTGYLDLTKTSSAPDISGATDYYRYDAQYGVYTDSACTQLAGSIRSNASGYGRSGALEVGDYYVKETVAPQGFELSNAVYSAHVTADTTTRVNGGTVTDKPKTVTVRFFVDGDTTPIHVDPDRPLGWNYGLNDPGVRIATGRAAKPNCTPGLDAWYTNRSCSSRWSGSVLMEDLDLYARNVATVTYASAAGSPLTEALPFRRAMKETSPLLNVSKDILPPHRQANWGSKISLKDPLLKIVYYHDGERWRTVRWVEGGWFANSAGVGTQITTLSIARDTVLYSDWTMSTYDGIFSW